MDKGPEEGTSALNRLGDEGIFQQDREHERGKIALGSKLVHFEKMSVNRLLPIQKDLATWQKHWCTAQDRGLSRDSSLGALEGGSDMASRKPMISFELEGRKSQGQHG